MKIEGRFSGASELVLVGANNTKKRTFVLDITGNSNYENVVEFSLIGDRTAFTDGLKNGEKIVVDYNLSGRRWRKDHASPERIFVDLQCFSISRINIEKVTGDVAAPGVVGDAVAGDAGVPAVVGADGDDLPF